MRTVDSEPPWVADRHPGDVFDRDGLLVVGQAISGTTPETAQGLIDTSHHRRQRLIPNRDDDPKPRPRQPRAIQHRPGPINHRAIPEIPLKPQTGLNYPTPRRIIGGVLTRRSGWTPPFGDPFEKCLGALDARDADEMTWGLDIGCAVAHGGFVVNRDKEAHASEIEHSDANVALIYFVMRLLRQLQTVGSAPAIDYDAYLKSVPGTS